MKKSLLTILSLIVMASSAQATVFKRTAIGFDDTLAVDAFNRLRVSQEISQINVVQLTDDQSQLLVDREVNGTGAASFQSNEASVDLTTAANLDFAIQQTFQRGHYNSGKSQIIKMTFANIAAETNVEKRAGYFTCNTTTPFNSNCDGIWISSETDGNYYVNVFRNGTQVDKVVRSSWDDPLDGTGPSAATIDFTKAQIFGVDFQYLGVGRVRFSFAGADGTPIIFHEVPHVNSIDTVYLSSPNLPLRWEIRQSGAGTGSFTSICGEVSSEGAINVVAATRAVDNTNVQVVGAANTKYAAVGIRLDASTPSPIVVPRKISLLSTSANDEFRWALCFNPTVAGTFTYNAVTGHPVQVAVGTASNTVSDCTGTDGKQIDSGYGASGVAATTFDIQFPRTLGVDINGVSDEIVLVVEPVDNAADILSSLRWEERY